MNHNLQKDMAPKIELELNDFLMEKITAMSSFLSLPIEDVIKKIIAENYWDRSEQIHSDVLAFAKKGEKIWIKVNLRDGQTFYGSIINVSGETDMKKIVLRNEFQELEYDIFLDLIASIKNPHDNELGPDKEYFLQPRPMQKDNEQPTNM